MKKLVLAACLMLFSANLFAQEIRYYIRDGYSLEGNSTSILMVSERGNYVCRRSTSISLHSNSSLNTFDRLVNELKRGDEIFLCYYDASLSTSSYNVYRHTPVSMFDSSTDYIAISKDKKTAIRWEKGNENRRIYYSSISRSELENACKPKAVNTDFLND
ncbi:MAG: hypothetical protein J6M30_02900 [Bacteroidales bacterium]|nr:hypothetical protein [Bacteroidales bacterium]